MKEDLQEVLSIEFGELVKTPLVLKLIKLYSTLYNNGKHIAGCVKCLRNYYTQLSKDGMSRILNFEEINARTCKPAWIGNKYIPATARHWSDIYLTDKEAIMLLESGHLKEKDFDVLPKSKQSPAPVATVTPAPVATKPSKSRKTEKAKK